MCFCTSTLLKTCLTIRNFFFSLSVINHVVHWEFFLYTKALIFTRWHLSDSLGKRRNAQRDWRGYNLGSCMCTWLPLEANFHQKSWVNSLIMQLYTIKLYQNASFHLLPIYHCETNSLVNSVFKSIVNWSSLVMGFRYTFVCWLEALITCDAGEVPEAHISMSSCGECKQWMNIGQL